MICDGEWCFSVSFNGVLMTKLPRNYLFVPKLFWRACISLFNTGEVKLCSLGRPTGRLTLFPHEECIITDYILQTPQIQWVWMALNTFHNYNYLKKSGFQRIVPSFCKAPLFSMLFRFPLFELFSFQFFASRSWDLMTKNCQEYALQTRQTSVHGN